MVRLVVTVFGALTVVMAARGGIASNHTEPIASTVFAVAPYAEAVTPTFSSFPSEVDCKCCQEGPSPNHWHSFTQTACTAEESPAAYQAEAFAQVLESARVSAPPVDPRDSGQENVEHTAAAVTTLRTLVYHKPASLIGEEGCGVNEECMQKTMTCYPGCGGDGTFHTTPDYSGFCERHNSCSEPEGLAVLEALDAQDYDAVARLYAKHRQTIRINGARQMIQVLNCRGIVHAQVRVDIGRLAVALQH